MKRKILAILLCISVIISLTSCIGKKQVLNSDGVETEAPSPVHTDEDEVRTISLIGGTSVKVEYYHDSYDTLLSAEYPSVYVYYEDENKFPALSKALEDEYIAKKKIHYDFIEENKDFAEEMYLTRQDSYYPLESVEKPYVRRADTVVTSIMHDCYTYEGGVHGYYYYYGDNYETSSGKKLELSDVVNDMDALYDAAEEQLRKFWSDVNLDEDITVKDVLSDKDFVLWTLDYNGITLYFAPYTFAAYASGAQVVTISNDEYPDILKDEYKKTPSSYGIELANNVPLYYDVTGDGELDEIIVSVYDGGYDDEGSISIYVNGNEYSESYWLYEAEATFVHMENDKNYVLLEVLLDGDYRETMCFELSETVKKTGSTEGGMRRIFHETEDFLTTKDIITNPESFYFQKRTHVLSTVTGYKEFYVGKKGIPVTDSHRYLFDEEIMVTLTLKIDIEADAFDEKTEKTSGKKLLKAGEEFLYHSTDGDKLAYIKAADGKMYCIEVLFDEEIFNYTVNGESVEKVFDGIIYAG